MPGEAALPPGAHRGIVEVPGVLGWAGCPPAPTTPRHRVPPSRTPCGPMHCVWVVHGHRLGRGAPREPPRSPGCREQSITRWSRHRGVPGHGTAPRRGRAADGSPGAGSANGQFPRAGKSSEKRKSPNSQKSRLVLSGKQEGQEWGCPRSYHRLGPILQGPVALGAPRGCPN